VKSQYEILITSGIADNIQSNILDGIYSSQRRVAIAGILRFQSIKNNTSLCSNIFRSRVQNIGTQRTQVLVLVRGVQFTDNDNAHIKVSGSQRESTAI